MLPALSYSLTSQAQRVNGYEIPGDEQPRIYTTDNLPEGSEIEQIIWSAYRQVFNEQQILESTRQIGLESQLRGGQITVREFVGNLAMSDSFRRLNYDSNTNYRFVEMCIQRLLGRQVYSNREVFAWSILLATKGLTEFINTLISSDEYLNQFGNNTVPYQRRRILPAQAQGELPFARMARYDSYHLSQVNQLNRWQPLSYGVSDRSAPVYRKVLVAVPVLAVGLLFATLVLTAAPQ
jgi:phycobilisome rod-core linker protein